MNIVALIRNPYDNIASWKNSFGHLKMGLVPNPIVQRHQDSSIVLNAIQEETLFKLENEKNASIRRCLKWNLLVSFIVANKGNLKIVQYEQLIKDPIDIVASALHIPQKYFSGDTRVRQTAAKRKDPLSEEDRFNIKTICSEMANEIGYSV